MRFASALLLLVVGLAVIVVIDRLPPQHAPWAPLDLEGPVGWATRMKLAGLDGDLPACRAAIERSNLAAPPIPDRREGAFCGFEGAVAIEKSAVRYSAPVRVSCPMAAALYLWEREVVRPAAARHFGSGVVRIDHVGTYACRRVYAGAAGRPSQHATANAIDITGFRLADGRRVSLSAGWEGEPSTRAFLRELRDGACRLFQGVLGPDYNAAHSDHFHFDMGPYRACR
jgi:hypothetical protein